MLKEAISHNNTNKYIYAKKRTYLVFRIRVARGDVKSCVLNYWARTNPEEKKKILMKCKQRDKMFDYYEVEVIFSKVARYQKYYFELEDHQNNKLFVSAYDISEVEPQNGYYEFLYANIGDLVSIPEWSKGQIYYHIFPERFFDGDVSNNREDCCSWESTPTRENYMGGDIKGITKKIQYLKELGVQCLYLNPIFKADFNHKYATTDYYTIDPEFGTKEDFIELVNICHKNEIRIILDGVFNHVGIHFKPFEDVLEKQEKSIYKDWFYITEYPVTISHHNYECVGGYKWMPKLNSSNLEVRKYILEVMDFWIREYHIDGWRLDVSDEVDAIVWQEARVILKDKYPNTLLLGETWGYGAKLVGGNQLDIIMNYVFRDIMLDFFAYRSIDVNELDSRINRMLAEYHNEINVGMYNLLDSHDTPRFLYECKGDKQKMKMAVAFQYFFLGSPTIYYGDEVGMTGDNDPDCRRAMEWDQNKQDLQLLESYQILGKIRNNEISIKKGEYFTVLCNKKTNTFGFIRKLEKEAIYIIFNNSTTETLETVPLIYNVDCYDIFEKKELTTIGKETQEVFYNQDILDYVSKVSIRVAPFSIRVIKQTYGGK